MKGLGALRLVVAAAAIAVVQAIYPDDHWQYSTKLTLSNFDSTIQREIDAGKTMFAPSWNTITKAFAGNSKVSFGDVNLSEDAIRGEPHNPGKGGWPTIRYFNKDTGVEGGDYKKKTQKAMCDELGDEDMMQALIEEYGNTSLCSVITKEGCDEKESAFIDKMKAKTSDDQATQLKRLEAMDESSMKPELYAWVKKRRKILAQMTTSASGDEL